MGYKIPYTKEPSPLADQMRMMGSEKLDLAMRHITIVQPTYGCSVGCFFCGCDVPKGVRAQMPVEIVDFLGENFQQQFRLRRPYTSGNNDSLDWSSRGKDFLYFAETIGQNGNWNPGACTAVPVGKEELAIEAARRGYLRRLSVSSVNEKRLRRKVPEIFDVFRELGIFVYYVEKKLIEIGRNSEGEYEADSLANRLGTVITPLGIYNCNLTHPSRRFQTGEIWTVINPDDFKVIEWSRRKDLHTEIWDYWIGYRNGAFPCQWLGENNTEVVDRKIANVHLFLKMFYRMGPAIGWQDTYLDAAQRSIRRFVRAGDLRRITPTNDASEQRLEKCVSMIPHDVRNLRKKRDHWSRRKAVVLERNLTQQL